MSTFGYVYGRIMRLIPFLAVCVFVSCWISELPLDLYRSPLAELADPELAS